MPDSEAQQRLADWRAAEKAERGTDEGSDERRRSVATARRARWAFEDAVRLARADHGVLESRVDETTRRLRRLDEALANSEAILASRPRRTPPAPPPETDEERDRRIAEEEEIARELGDLN